MAEKGFLFGSKYPLYCICQWKDDVFVIAGGGGKAKTGIKNGVEFHRLLYDESNSNSLYSHECISHHYTDSSLWMQFNINPHNDHMLASSIESECRLYNIKEIEEKENVVDKDKESLSEKETISNRFELTKTTSVTTDFTSKCPFQNVVRFIHDGSHVLTGGQDGVVRVWKVPDLIEVCSRNAHSGEITDIATHPTKELSVSISRDGTAKVWNSLTDKKETKEFTANKGHRFRACGFSNNEENCNFYAVSIPVKWSNKLRQYCYLTKWDTLKWTEIKSVKTGSQLITSMTILDQYIGIGDTDGSVTMFTTNLKLLRKVNGLHSSSVTDLCFLSLPSSKKQNTVLLSVSVDKSCCATEVKQTGSSAWWIYVVILALVVLLVALYIEYL